jgi:hypothetical protein
MKFAKAKLLELMEEPLRDAVKHPNSPKVHASEDGKVGRWSVGHSFVFEHEGRFYMASYSVGATECQDESPFEYDGDEVECPEVAAVEVRVTRWLPVAAAAKKQGRKSPEALL